MDSFEYTFVDISGPAKKIGELNRLGTEGWEAVGMVSTWGAKEWRFVHPVVLLKRPLSSSSQPIGVESSQGLVRGGSHW